MNNVALFAILVAVVHLTNGDENEKVGYPRDGYFKPEKTCNSQGGICILDELCDSPRKDVKSCPLQRSKGAVCCDRLPKNETRCEKLGGACIPMDDCRRGPMERATDCSDTEACCSLG